MKLELETRQATTLLLIWVAGWLGGCTYDEGSTGREKVQHTGQSVGRAAGDLVGGVAAGVRSVSRDKLEVAPELTAAGLRTGRYSVKSALGTGNRRTLNVYVMFDKDLKRTVTLKAIDRDGNEYGRLQRTLRGKAGEARYEEFVVQAPERVPGRSRFILE